MPSQTQWDNILEEIRAIKVVAQNKDLTKMRLRINRLSSQGKVIKKKKKVHIGKYNIIQRNVLLVVFHSLLEA